MSTPDGPSDFVTPADEASAPGDAPVTPEVESVAAAPSAGGSGVVAAADVGEIAVEVEAPPPSTADLAAARVRELEAALAAAEQGKKDNWDKYLRSVADVENGRKRAKRDIDEARAESRSRVLKEMLPVVDNLERAIEHAGTGGDAVIEGIKLVLRQFTQAFERLEVTAVEAQGLPFDPNMHEAISQQETDEHPPGTVVQVLQRGYKNGDRLLRPAMVVVARAKAKVEPSA